MRLFFALPIPPHVQTRLAEWQNLWSKTVPNVKWVNKENMHLTVKFLGEVSTNQLEQIIIAARSSLTGYSQFNLLVNGTGVFPNRQRARVLWVGLKDNSGQLFLLQQQLEKTMARLGFPRDKKPFTPHLTLGRLRQPSHVAPPIFPVKHLVIPINCVILYKSTLTPKGPLYQSLAEFKLQ